jgi:hypothetical protein
MYADCLTWRSTMLPVSKESCLSVLQRGMFFFHGEDKEGRPLGYLTMRGHDPKTRDLDQCLRAIIYQCEALIASKGGKEFQVRFLKNNNIYLFYLFYLFIFQFEGFSFSFLSHSTFKITIIVNPNNKTTNTLTPPSLPPSLP